MTQFDSFSVVTYVCGTGSKELRGFRGSSSSPWDLSRSHRKGSVMRRLRSIWSDESGTTAVEYSVMLGFIMLVLIGAVAAFGSGQSGKWVGIWNIMRRHGL